MMYALVILGVLLLAHAVSKYKDIASMDADPLDEARLLESIRQPVPSKKDVFGAGGDGQHGTAEPSMSNRAPDRNQSNTTGRNEFNEPFEKDDESWVADIRFTDNQDRGGKGSGE